MHSFYFADDTGSHDLDHPAIAVTGMMLIAGLRYDLELFRRSRDLAPWFSYVAALFLFTAIVSAVHVPYGTFIHSAVALLPHAYLLVVVGLTAAVGWVASHRPSWDAPRASRNFSFMLVGVIAAASIVATISTTDAWKRERDGRVEVLATLAEVAGRDDIVMSPDAGAYQFHGDWTGIVTPDDPLTTVEQAMRLYDVRWLALEGAHITAGLRPVLAGEVRPAWLSEPLLEVPPLPPAEDEEDAESEPLPRAALYAVCLAPADPRCDP